MTTTAAATRSELQRAALAERMVPLAQQLVGAVHDDGLEGVSAVLGRIRPGDLDALAVVLAAMVDPDRSAADLLKWVDWTLDCDRDRAPLYLVEVPDDVRAGHAAFVRAKAAGRDPEPWRHLEREYQKQRHQQRHQQRRDRAA